MPAVRGEVVYKGPAPAVAPPKSKVPLRGPVIKTTTEPVPKVGPVVDGPPVPALLAHGFAGGIDKFNQRAQTVHDSYTKAYGVPPSPGLTFDLAKSPVDESQFAHMFTVPQNPLAAQARGVVNNHPPQDTLVVRHDGYVEQAHPTNYALLAHGGQLGPQPQTPGAPAQPSKTLAQYQALQKQHPYVAMGMLPLPTNLLNGFWQAVEYAQKNPGATKPLTTGGLTVDQYQKEEKIGEAVTGSQAGVAGLYSKSLAPGNDTLVTPAQLSAQAQKEVGAKGATTVQQAQQKLKELAPDFFGSLSAGGFINSDWAKAIGKYQTSSLYFAQQTAKLAEDNHFGGNKAAFVHAWKAKQQAIKAQPFLATFIAHQPLAFFDYRTHGKAIANLIDGDTKGWGWANVPTVLLGGLAHTAGLAFNELAGTVDQAKQDSAFVSAYMNTKFVKKRTQAEAQKAAFVALKKNPTWARFFYPDYEDKGVEGALGQIANIGIDLWISSPKFTGERIAAADSGAFIASPYVAKKAEWAYNSLKDGKLGDAVNTLEGGRGSENLAVMLEPGVKDGTVSLGQFKQHLTELYTQGHTALGDAAVTDASGLFRSLRTKDLVTPGKPGRAAKIIHEKVSALNDQFEESLRARTKGQGVTQHAVDYVSSVRQLFARAAPKGEPRAMFDTRTPEDTYNYARVHLDASPSEAASLRDELIRLRAADNVQGISDFSDRLRSLYEAKHPGVEVKGAPTESSGPELESESAHLLYFPAGIESRAEAINTSLNKIGKLHRQTIVSGSPIFGLPIPGGGESLFWKHTFADTTRRIVGGGGFLKASKAGKDIVESHLKENPQAIREVGTARSSSIMGETRYITGQKSADPLSFNTGDTELQVAGKDVERSNALHAAGGYLRNNLTSNGLKAFQASTKDNLQPLVELVMKDKFYRSQLDKMVEREVEKNPIFHLASADSVVDKAHIYAEALFNRYSEIENAGKTAGVADPLNEALDVLIKNVGPKADKVLAHWIDDKGINLPVREGLVERKQFDDAAQWWIGKLMTANKWNRGKLFDHVFYGTVKDLTDAGWKTEEAIPVAADLAKTQTITHMLDFSNMMQVEQNMRWLSYFATKHRLYWSWIIKQAVRRPGLAAPVHDVQQHLDAKGNLPISLFGHQLNIPVARLFWVNATELPQTSPIVQFIAEGGKAVAEGQGLGAFNTAYGSLTSTSGNLFTRDDQAEMYGVKLALVASGHMASNSDAVTFGMTADQKRSFQAQVNEYSAFYRQEHGVYPSEADAVKHTLIAQTAQSFWNTNLPLPVTPATGRSPRITKLTNEYGAIIDPVKKREFLESHPAVALQFGVSQDPTVYLHVNQLWDKFNAAYASVKAGRAAIMQEITSKGEFTPDIQKQMKALSAKWSATIDALKLEDAETWHGTAEFPAGKVSDGQVSTPGPWTIQLSGDPLAARAFVHQSFPNIKPPQLDAHTVGQRILDLQQRAAQLRQVKTDADAVKWGQKDLQGVHDELSAITQQLAPFFAYPTSAPAQLQSEYYKKFVTPYQRERDKLAALTANTSADNLDQVKSQLRAWKDQHDHPVFLEFQGKKIKFPSVVQIGWATLPDGQRHLALQQAASGDWAHIAAYEKTMLGIKTPPDVGTGWSEYYKAVTAYNKNPANTNLVAAQKAGLAKQIDKVYPGFYKDFIFAQQPKIDRFKHTDLYKQMPAKAEFDQYVTGPAEKLAKAIKANGSRSYYEQAWRNYVEQQIIPWLADHPALKAEIAGYGPNFLNTLPAVSSP